MLLASAGGLQAIVTVLGDLPKTFRAAIVVQQHLAPHNSALPTILRRATTHQVDWAHDGQLLVPGQVAVGPPGRYLEVTPSGHCRLREVLEHGERRFDVLLMSVAGGYGPRSAAAVLSGSGRDGAAGVAAMKRAGAVVIAESPVTAQYRSMPMAAAGAGADVVLPVYEIGHALTDIVAGTPLPAPSGGAPAAAVWGSTDTTHRDAPHDPRLDHAVTKAAGRAEFARLRADELRRRRNELFAGFGATAETVSNAQRRARESRRRAQLAHQASEEAAARWESLTAATPHN